MQPYADEHIIGSYKIERRKTVSDKCEKFGKEILHLPVVN